MSQHGAVNSSQPMSPGERERARERGDGQRERERDWWTCAIQDKRERERERERVEIDDEELLECIQSSVKRTLQERNGGRESEEDGE